jgi:hypothetical protein
MKLNCLSLLFACLLIGSASGLRAGVVDAGDLIESYTARLSARDHFNSNGQRLTTPAAIVRQDRANFYAYGIRDPEDQPDQFFSRKENRELLESLLDRGQTTPGARMAIVNGTPLIRVDIYQRFINVTIVSE